MPRRFRVRVALLALMLGLSLLGSGVASGAKLDRNFGVSGTAVYDHGGTLKWAAELDEWAGEPSALKMDGRGRILVGGGSGASLLVLRYLPDGVLDPSFGDGGIVRIWQLYVDGGPGDNPAYAAPRVRDLVVKDDGRILLVAETFRPNDSVEGNPADALVMLTQDGQVDTSFGSRPGVQPGVLPLSIPRSAALTESGDLLIAGSSITSFDDLAYATNYAGYVMKRDQDGLPVQGFGRPYDYDSWPFHGIQTFVPGGPPHFSAITKLKPLASGKILAGGHDRNRFMLTRLTETGRADRSFGRKGSGGRTIANFGGKRCFCVAGGDMDLDGRGRVVQVGYSSFPTKKKISTIALVRYRRNGTIDRSFGNRGFAFSILGSSVKATSIKVQNNGRILVTARKGFADRSRFLVLRYLSNGKLDRTFFGDGKYVADLGTTSIASKVVLDGKGRAVVAGGAAIGGTGHFVLKRLLLNR